MLRANRLSHSAYNVALKGWVSVQICPARALCQNSAEKTLRNPYFSGASRFLGRSCDSPPSPAPKAVPGPGGAAPVCKTIQHASVKQGGLQENGPWWKSPRGTVTSISVRLPGAHQGASPEWPIAADGYQLGDAGTGPGGVWRVGPELVMGLIGIHSQMSVSECIPISITRAGSSSG